jgi:hypothetical protein
MALGMREQVNLGTKSAQNAKRWFPLDSQSFVYTAMFTISPGDELALEEHDAGETAKGR